MIPDWELLARARSGDEAAWELLIGTHRPRLMRLALLVTRDTAAADDAVQDAFVRLLDYDVPHTSGAFASLASTIVYRLAVKERKRSNRHMPLEGVDPANPDSTPLDGVLRRERDRQLVRALFSLDDSHLDILVLRFYGEHSYVEIAAMTGLPLGTVKSRMFYAVQACRRELIDKGFSP